MSILTDLIEPGAKVYLVMGIHPAGRIATRFVLAASAELAIKASRARMPGETAAWSTVAATAWETLESERDIFVTRLKEGIGQN